MKMLMMGWYEIILIDNDGICVPTNTTNIETTTITFASWDTLWVCDVIVWSYYVINLRFVWEKHY